jgi:hypothetical protein
MHKPGALLAANAEESWTVVKQGMNQSSARMAGGGMDDKAGGFVEDEEGVVFESDVQRNRFGFEGRGAWGRKNKPDPEPWRDAQAGFRGTVFDRDVPFAEEGLDAGAREIGPALGKPAVEALPLIFRWDDQFLGHASLGRDGGKR